MIRAVIVTGSTFLAGVPCDLRSTLQSRIAPIVVFDLLPVRILARGSLVDVRVDRRETDQHLVALVFQQRQLDRIAPLDDTT